MSEWEDLQGMGVYYNGGGVLRAKLAVLGDSTGDGSSSAYIL